MLPFHLAKRREFLCVKLCVVVRGHSITLAQNCVYVAGLPVFASNWRLLNELETQLRRVS